VFRQSETLDFSFPNLGFAQKSERSHNAALSRLQNGASIHCVSSLQNDKDPSLLPSAIAASKMALFLADI